MRLMHIVAAVFCLVGLVLGSNILGEDTQLPTKSTTPQASKTLLKASGLTGMKVQNTMGEELGKVEDFAMDPAKYPSRTLLKPDELTTSNRSSIRLTPSNRVTNDIKTCRR